MTTYTFRRSGTENERCTYCPKPPNEHCGRDCAAAYEALQKERAADGIKVDDEPGKPPAAS